MVYAKVVIQVNLQQHSATKCICIARQTEKWQ